MCGRYTCAVDSWAVGCILVELMTRRTLFRGADYVQHSLKSADSGLQNRLNANLNADVIENWMFLEANATVAQRALSASGQQTVAGSVQANSNRAEVGTVYISPSVRGSLGGLVRYDVRVVD